MSNSEQVPGSSSNSTNLNLGLGSSPAPVPGGGGSPPQGSAAPPSINNVTPPPPRDNETSNSDNSPLAPPQSSSPPPAETNPPSSPPAETPPPSPRPAETPPPSLSNPPPPSPSNSQPSSSEPPTSSPPPPSTSASPPEKSSPTSSPPPAADQQSPPPSPEQSSSPPAVKPSTPPPTNGSIIPPPSQPSPPPPVEFTPTSPPLGPDGRPGPSRPISPPSRDASPPTAVGSSNGHSSPRTPDAKISKTSITPPGNGSESTPIKAVVGAVVASAVLVMLVAIFLVVRRKKRRRDSYVSRYMPPGNFNVNTDGFYYGQQQHAMGVSGQANYSYSSQPPLSTFGGSYGSQSANTYGGPDSGVIGGSMALFSYEELMEITNGFSRQNIIGEGGFGCVYKGWMPDGKVVAVKLLKAGSGQGDREFKAEVEIISRVHHRHLVSLVGYCISDNQRSLIYEFVPNNTLEHHLHAKGQSVLDWPKRLKIAVGSAKGLAYLHEDCHPKIIHRDIKSANILLDDGFEAQVADFGLARLNDTSQTHVSTRVMGTFGYLAPEYASSGKLTDRSDVFSFGVVLLELITGRKPVDPSQPLGDESLVEWARPLLIQALETGDLGELVDPRLEKHYVENEMFRMVETAAACVRHSAPKRPRMVQVLRALDSENEMSDLSNGTKYGQSTVYDSGQYNQDITKFRRMALGSHESLEYSTYSGEYTSGDATRGLATSSPYTSGESETQAINQPGHWYK